MRIAGAIASLFLLLAGCGETPSSGPVRVSVIDTLPVRSAMSPGRAVLVGATTRGIVRLDGDGQVAPDVAVRWAIVENGRDYIFRIDDFVPAYVVARKLRAAIRSASARGLRPALAAIDSIAAVTPTVVEIRLSTPLPQLLALLARPELALVGIPGAMAEHKQGELVLLTQREPANGAAPPVLFRQERPGKAVARFMAGASDLVLGGTFETFGVVRAASPPAEALRIDPTTGLFGLAARSPLLAEPGVARALSLAVDRDRLLGVIGPRGLAKATTIAGSTIEAPLDQRLIEARRLIGQAPLAIRVALPEGAAAGALFRLLEQDWSRVGVSMTRVGPDAPADLALVDVVAPAEALHQLACAASAGCDPRSPLAQLDPPFIPLSAPLRWSLVARRLDGFTPNAAATHPLDRLLARR